MPGPKDIGDQAETLARNFLTKKSFQILLCNFQTRFGEIDIIALDKNDLVFIEVRYRKSNAYGGAIASITANKQKRLITSAEIYLQQNRQHKHRNMRFDVIAIQAQPNQPKFQLDWIKDAFQTSF